MKRFILLLSVAILIATEVSAQHTKKKNPHAYTLIVDVSAIHPQPVTVYFMYFFMTPNGASIKSDSLEVIRGRAVAKGIIAEPSLCVLQTKLMGVSSRFMLASGTTIVKAGKDISQIAITGKPYQNDVELLYKEQSDYSDKVLKPIALAYQEFMDKKDTLAAKAKYAEFAAAQMHSADTWKAYAIQHAKSSPLSVFALKMASDAESPGIDSIYNLLAPAYQKTPTGLSIKSKLDREHAIAVGQQAPQFSQPDTSGKVISLASFKGKYVLVDFWASWCHPCREESPYLIKAYEKYHGNKFEILSVSLDSKGSQQAWMKAIHDDKTNAWTQVSDLQGWKNAASVLYGINSIPQNYLLDPTGKIIATNLRGDDVEKMIGQLINKM